MNTELMAAKAWARGEIENCMNRYEFLLCQGEVQYVYDNVFANWLPDVRFELPSGCWEGPEALYRVVVNLHGKFYNNKGAMVLYPNTNPIIEIADDLKTAKGCWEGIGFGAGVDEDGPWGSQAANRRFADFIFDEKTGTWRMWHYVVAGWFSTPWGEPPSTLVDSKDSSQTEEAWAYRFTEDCKPTRKPAYVWEYSQNSQVTYYPKAPEPYKTWEDTFSY